MCCNRCTWLLCCFPSIVTQCQQRHLPLGRGHLLAQNLSRSLFIIGWHSAAAAFNVNPCQYQIINQNVTQYQPMSPESHLTSQKSKTKHCTSFHFRCTIGKSYLTFSVDKKLGTKGWRGPWDHWVSWERCILWLWELLPPPLLRYPLQPCPC